ncbi:MAG TPA: CCA tRNA nucleotidyltransferase [Candidatus Cloacimonadota bacterium]|jgi:tRNA nucleotidyltransferase/poly(A) polymerase|nr:CCA tRNA nucleotidyltransferase [Candidatus Cloacimonadota bacterium]MDD4666668.1 CCA tRNA nucleotidyltransferase [Candidatus Cloacimonadota bacterium]HPF09151.1 CCA tRNA nucleotidyltransferase [Candidatus Cloacimonadota bacterium]
MTLPELRQYMQELTQGTVYAGKTYIVGGAVRDYLLGIVPITDYDLCVALPGGGIKLGGLILETCKDATLCRVNKRFGTIGLKLCDISLDLAATRRERYTEGSRYPRVRYGSLLEDVYRRDFTINALMMSLDNAELLDLCKMGLDDLKQGVIRTLREPQLVLKEDPLRIMRAVRFATRFDFSFSDDLTLALRECSALVKSISGKRQAQELKLLKADGNLAKALELYSTLGIQQYLKPGEA